MRNGLNDFPCPRQLKHAYPARKIHAESCVSSRRNETAIATTICFGQWSKINRVIPMIDAVENHRDDLTDLAESDLPCSEIADALLEVVEDGE